MNIRIRLNQDEQFEYTTGNIWLSLPNETRDDLSAKMHNFNRMVPGAWMDVDTQFVDDELAAILAPLCQPTTGFFSQTVTLTDDTFQDGTLVSVAEAIGYAARNHRASESEIKAGLEQAGEFTAETFSIKMREPKAGEEWEYVGDQYGNGKRPVSVVRIVNVDRSGESPLYEIQGKLTTFLVGRGQLREKTRAPIAMRIVNLLTPSINEWEITRQQVHRLTPDTIFPDDYIIRLHNASEFIASKLVVALKQHGLSDDEVADWIAGKDVTGQPDFGGKRVG